MSGVVFPDLPGLEYNSERSMALQHSHEAFTEDVLSDAVVYTVRGSDRIVITATRFPFPGCDIYVDNIDVNSPLTHVRDNSALRDALERMSERMTAG